MTVMNQLPLKLFVFLALASYALPSRAQGAPSAVPLHPLELGGSFTYLHTNLLPGCNCFSLKGGDLQVAVGLRPALQVVAEAGATQRGGITADGYAITQVTYTFGLRYLPLSRSRVRPLGEALFGGAHALGSLSPGNNAVGGTSNAVDLIVGGGVAVRLDRHLVLQPARVDYELTNFRNGQANHQNDVRLSAGLLYRFGG